MGLAEGAAAYHADTVEKDIREFFRAERRRLQLNQQDVAAAGGLEQSTVSKIERDPPYDPGIKSFLGAIRGLGMKPSEFFARFEQRAGSNFSIGAQLPNRVLQTKTAGATVSLPLDEQDGHAPDLAASASIAQLLQRIEVLERSALHDIKNADRKRKTSARPRAKSASGAKDRTHARRRA